MAPEQRLEDSRLGALVLVAVHAANEKVEMIGGSARAEDGRVGDLEAATPSSSGLGVPDLVLVPVGGDDLGGAESVVDACEDGRVQGSGPFLVG